MNHKIESYIHILLFTHDCVVIPHFGGIIANYTPAEIHPLKHTFVPPKKKLAFNQNVRLNDGLLLQTLASGEGISQQEAQSLIEKEVNRIQEELDKGSRVELEGVGCFYLNDEGSIQFDPNKEINYLDKSFGLSDFHFKPIERTETEMRKQPVYPPQAQAAMKRAAVSKPTEQARPSGPKQEESKKSMSTQTKPKPQQPEGSKKSKSFLVIPIVVIVLAGAFASLFYIQDGKYMAALFPSMMTDKEESSAKTDKPIKMETASATTAEKEVPSSVEPGDAVSEVKVTESENTSTSGTGIDVNASYLIVAGVFSSRANAEAYAKGRFSTYEISNIGGLYKIAVGSYASKSSAFGELNNYRSQYGQDVWVQIK